QGLGKALFAKGCGYQFPLVLANVLDDFAGTDLAHTGQQSQNAVPGNGVKGVEHNAQIGKHVLDVAALNEADATIDHKGDTAFEQLCLQIIAVEPGPVEHGHVPKGQLL